MKKCLDRLTQYMGERKIVVLSPLFAAISAKLPGSLLAASYTFPAGFRRRLGWRDRSSFHAVYFITGLAMMSCGFSVGNPAWRTSIATCAQ